MAFDFGKVLVDTVNRHKELVQKKDQFDRQHALESQKLKLLNIFRDKELAESKRYHDYLIDKQNQPHIRNLGKDIAIIDKKGGLLGKIEAPAQTEQKMVGGDMYDVITDNQGNTTGYRKVIQGDPDNRYERTKTVNEGGVPVEYGLIKGTNKWERTPGKVWDSSSANSNNIKPKDISSELANLKFFTDTLVQFDGEEDDKRIKFGDEQISKSQARDDAQAELEKALAKSGIPRNGQVLNYMRNYLEENDTPEVKRVVLNQAMTDAKREFNLNEQQIEAIRYWIEIGTR